MEGTKAIYGVGGGITWDSNWEAEYEETKQKLLFYTVRTPNPISFQLVVPSRKNCYFEEHMKRLQESSRHLTILSMQKSTL